MKRIRKPKRRGRLQKRDDGSELQRVITDPQLLSKRLRIERVLTVLSVLSLLILTLVFIALFAFGVHKLGIIEFPEPIEALFGGDKETEPSEITDDFALIELISELEDGDIPESDHTAALVLDEGEYLSLIENAETISDYYVILNLSTTDTVARSEKRCHIWRMGDKYRAEIYDTTNGGRLLSVTVCDGDEVSVTDHAGYDEPVSRIFKADDGFTLEDQIGIPGIDDFVGRDDIENLVIRLLRTESANLFHVAYNYVGLTQVEELYVSLDHRLILAANTTAVVGSDVRNVYRLEAVRLIEGKEAFGGDEDGLFTIDR